MIFSIASGTCSPAEAGAEDLANRGALGGRAAERDLVELLALLIEAENADMADMVVAAGIDAARDVDLQRADLLLAVKIGEAARDALGDRNGARCRQRAVVEAGAGDDVADQPEIGARQLVGPQDLPDGVEVAAFYMRQHEILVVADPQFIE